MRGAAEVESWGEGLTRLAVCVLPSGAGLGCVGGRAGARVGLRVLGDANGGTLDDFDAGAEGLNGRDALAVAPIGIEGGRGPVFLGFPLDEPLDPTVLPIMARMAL